MKKIFIIPTVRKKYKNQIEYCIDKRIFLVLKKAFKKIEIKSELDKSVNLIVILGGNDLVSIKKNQENFIKEKLSNIALSFCKRNKVPILGICGGAQFLAKKHGSLISKTAGHVGSHSIIWKNKKVLNKKVKLPRRVNSYHNYKIIKLGKNLSLDAYTKDGSIELFKNKKSKIYGIMWHPERNKTINKFDIEFLKQIK
tara:strand:+ start:69 stop:662 length:594 start_codon:yes stop_codon:yes gene_type:complete